MRVGIEVGGTFTDLVAIDGEGRVVVAKAPSTPAEPDRGAFDALAASGVDVAAVEDLVHGSTVATNAVLERKGARIAFVATRGFRDILVMQRHGRDRIYDLAYRKPEPVARRRDCFEVAERVLADGTVLEPLDLAAAERELIPRLREGGYEAVAICLLNAYVNPAHEEALEDLVARHCQGVRIARSSAVAREFREYERASTVALSAYVQPVVDAYLERFESRLADAGFSGRFSVMQSNGGRLPAGAMRRNAVAALLSGPAAGVTGAIRQAGRSGYRDLLTFDMGGTSTDVCLVTGGEPTLAAETALDGLPVRAAVVDIVTVGAGGGSIVWIDDGGMLRAGPRSAGAEPGPACYGRGGTEPTVTDAHVVRGALRPAAFLDGRMAIDPEAARAAFRPIADALGATVEQAADAAIRVTDANAVRAMQIVSTERGEDPRDYAMVAFGGAGPLHAARVAEELGVATVVVPPDAGVLSAWGLLAADHRQFESVTRRTRLDDAAPAVAREVFGAMRRRAVERFASMGLGRDPELAFHADMRFVGQAFEIAVGIDADALPGLDAAALRRAFAAEHHRVFMHGGEATDPVEIVAFRLGVRAPAPELPAPRADDAAPAAPEPLSLYERGAWREAIRGRRAALRPGDGLAGPALLEDGASTVLVPPGWTAEADDRRNLILVRRSAGA